MPIGWYIVPYKIRRKNGMISRYPAIDDYTRQIFAASGDWAETEILGDRAIVKVRASDSILAVLDGQYKRLPKDILDDSLSDLSAAVKTALKNELLDMGYSLVEIQQTFGADIGLFTLRDVLKFMTTRRLKPRYDAPTNTIIVDGIEQKCRPLESVDKQVQ